MRLGQESLGPALLEVAQFIIFDIPLWSCSCINLLLYVYTEAELMFKTLFHITQGCHRKKRCYCLYCQASFQHAASRQHSA